MAGGYSLPTGRLGGVPYPGGSCSTSPSSSHHCQSLLLDPPAAEMVVRWGGKVLGNGRKGEKKKTKRR